MSVLVTGSAGHLGEALMRHFKATGQSAIGLDINASPYTDVVGSITDKALIRDVMRNVSVVLNTATLHKPHVVTHGPYAFVETNVTGTLNLLEAAREAAVNRFVYTSTTSVFGDALRPPTTAPTAWVTEAVEPIPKNIYGVTKRAAEDLCLLYSRKFGVNCTVLRTSRFFPDDDDNKETRDQFDSLNAKVNELLYRRVELDDVVSAHCLAMDYVTTTPFDRFIISATSPFHKEDCPQLRNNAQQAIDRYVPQARAIYERRGWSMFAGLDRVYINQHAREALGWEPEYSFERAIQHVDRGEDPRGPLAQAVGSKGYHDEVFEDGPFPVTP